MEDYNRTKKFLDFVKNYKDEKSFYDLNRENRKTLFVNTKENAIDFLETAVHFFERDDNLKWKWIGISIDQSLYAFCIMSLENGNYDNVLIPSKKGKQNLIGFETSLTRVQDEKYWMRRMVGVKPVKLTREENKRILWLHDRVRNEFLHFIPKGLTIGINDMRLAILSSLRIIEFLCFESGSIHYLLDPNNRTRISDAIKSIRLSISE
ncbi:MAG: hypothetical protein AB1728_15150 [Bacteroidota bacterium]